MEMGRPYRAPEDPRARNCSLLTWSFRRPCRSSAVVFHGECGRGRSKEARLEDRWSSLGSGVVRKRREVSFEPLSIVDRVLRWARFSKWDSKEDTGLRCKSGLVGPRATWDKPWRTMGVSSVFSWSMPFPSIAISKDPSPIPASRIDHKLDCGCLGSNSCRVGMRKLE